jgi:hypothetical protein
MRISACSSKSVASTDYKRWSLYEAPWLQPAATGRKSEPQKDVSNKRKLLAIGCDQLPFQAHGKGRVATSKTSRASGSSRHCGTSSLVG